MIGLYVSVLKQQGKLGDENKINNGVFCIGPILEQELTGEYYNV